MRLEYLREFQVLAHHLNYSTAALELDVSQPNLSKHISSLEKELGFRLFERRGVVNLTLEGALYLDVVNGILSEHNAIIQKCRQLHRNELGRLRILKPPSYNEGFEWLYARLAEYKEMKPDCLISFEQANSEYSIDHVRDGKVDMAICATSIGDVHDLMATGRRYDVLLEPIASARLVLWVHKDNPLAQAGSVRLSELRDIRLSFAANRLFDYLRYAYNALLPDSSVQPVGPFHAYAAGNMEEFLMSLTREDVCMLTWGMLSHPVIAARRDRVALPIEDESAQLIYFLAHIAHSRNEEVNRLIDYLMSQISNEQAGALQDLISSAPLQK